MKGLIDFPLAHGSLHRFHLGDIIVLILILFAVGSYSWGERILIAVKYAWICRRSVRNPSGRLYFGAGLAR